MEDQTIRSKLKGQAARPISTGELHAFRRSPLPPIKPVVYVWPSGTLRPGIPHLGVGFPLRCFQRLSCPDMATRRCRWRDNRYTRGPFVSVLSYWRQLPSRILRPRQIGTKLSHDVLNPTLVPL